MYYVSVFNKKLFNFIIDPKLLLQDLFNTSWQVPAKLDYPFFLYFIPWNTLHNIHPRVWIMFTLFTHSLAHLNRVLDMPSDIPLRALHTSTDYSESFTRLLTNLQDLNTPQQIPARGWHTSKDSSKSLTHLNRFLPKLITPPQIPHRAWQASLIPHRAWHGFTDSSQSLSRLYFPPRVWHTSTDSSQSLTNLHRFLPELDTPQQIPPKVWHTSTNSSKSMSHLYRFLPELYTFPHLPPRA